MTQTTTQEVMKANSSSSSSRGVSTVVEKEDRGLCHKIVCPSQTCNPVPKDVDFGCCAVTDAGLDLGFASKPNQELNTLFRQTLVKIVSFNTM